jgi:hypothetical protein
MPRLGASWDSRYLICISLLPQSGTILAMSYWAALYVVGALEHALSNSDGKINASVILFQCFVLNFCMLDFLYLSNYIHQA